MYYLFTFSIISPSRIRFRVYRDYYTIVYSIVVLSKAFNDFLVCPLGSSFDEYKKPSMLSDSQHDITIFCPVGTFSINMFSLVKARLLTLPAH